MSSQGEFDQFTVFENKSIGRNMALLRKLRDKKAIEVAEYVGISESAYTKYERGETKITVELIQKVAEFLKVDPLQIVAASPSTFLENIQNSSIAIQENSTFSTHNEKQDEMMLKLIENMMIVSQKLIELLEKEK